MLLACDIGGTNTRLALGEFLEGRPILRKEALYPTKDLTDLGPLLISFLKEEPITGVSIALAGPVEGTQGHLTNHSLSMDATRLTQELPGRPPVLLHNDLEAFAAGVSILDPSAFIPLREGRSDSKAPKVLLVPGTGLGEALLIEGKPWPSEGAHGDYGPRSDEEIGLWRFLSKRYGHVSYERILSGPGLSDLHQFQSGEMVRRTPEEILGGALDGSSPTSLRAVDLFLSILGGEAGNLALKAGARGGILLGGSLLNALRPFFSRDSFTSGYLDKGRFRKWLEKIPIHLIEEPKVALLGALVLYEANDMAMGR